jgi:5,5'-dehydrodivanillate O-demethylase
MELLSSLDDGSLGSQLRIDQCGPETLSGRYLRRFWTPVAMLNDVAPGRAKDVHILGEHFTYYRGATGDPHLVAQLCPHRHVQLSLGWVEGDCIRCVYHGWKYDTTGQCIEQPAEFESFARKVRLLTYPLRELHGLVFAYFGEGEPPPFPRLAPLERPGHFVPSSYVRETNFLNAIENNADWIHIAFVHGRSGFADAGVNRELPTMSAEETPYGIAGTCSYADGGATKFHMLMPLTSYLKIVSSDPSVTMDHIAWRVPIDDRSHRSFIIGRLDIEGESLERFLHHRNQERQLQSQLPPARETVDAILRGEMHLDDVSEARPDLVGIQDSAVMMTQPPIGDREQDQLGRSDIAVIKLRRLWYREIDALAGGRPLTAWDWSGDLIAELGVR